MNGCTWPMEFVVLRFNWRKHVKQTYRIVLICWTLSIMRSNFLQISDILLLLNWAVRLIFLRKMRRIQENWLLNIILKFINNQPVIENSLINIFFYKPKFKTYWSIKNQLYIIFKFIFIKKRSNETKL